MPSRYTVSYDITADQRRGQVYKAMRGFGDHIQYCVFRCDLSRRERVAMIATLHPLMDHDDGQMRVFDLGPIDDRAGHCVEAMGR